MADTALEVARLLDNTHQVAWGSSADRISRSSQAISTSLFPAPRKPWSWLEARRRLDLGRVGLRPRTRRSSRPVTERQQRSCWSAQREDRRSRGSRLHRVFPACRFLRAAT